MLSAFFPAEQQEDAKPAPASSVGPGSSKRATVTQTTSPAKAPGSLSQPAAAVGSSRTLRFPSSRRYLWDRTAAGPQVLVEVLDYLPHVQVAASTFGAISRAASSKAGSLTLQLRLSVSKTNQVTVLVEEHDPLGGRDALQLSCAVREPTAAAHDAVSSLRAAVQAHLDQRDIARVQQLYALSATAAAAASPAEPTCVRLQLLMPCAGLLATPLYTKRMCHVPLAEALLKPGCMAAGQTGYLSMDQARSLLPLEATDANVYSSPLVGVWVKGPASVLHPLVVSACLRFAYSSLLLDRAVNQEDGAFLLLLCPEGDPVSKCFEVCVTDSSVLQLSCYRLEAGVRPAGGTSQFPGGVVSAAWLPEQGQVQPLPGTLRPPSSSSRGLLAAGSSSSTRQTTPAGTPSRAAAAASGFTSRGPLQQDPTLPAFHGATDSPVLHARSSHLSHLGTKAGQLPGERSSAPSAAFGYGQLQHDAAAGAAGARRSLPLATYAGEVGFGYNSGNWAAAGATGLAVWPGEEPQPRSGMPAAPYVPSSYAGGSSQQQQEGYAQGQWAPQAAAVPDPQPSASPVARQQAPLDAAHSSLAAAAAAVGGAAGGASGSGSSPNKAFHLQQRQQQLMAWSDRQDQVLRSSLEGAAEALRVSQASLAAAREAASGASGSLSPTKKPQGTAAATAAAAAGTADAGPEATSPVAAAAAAAAPASPQPPLSRLGQQQQQQPQAGHVAEGGQQRNGSPVRMGLQKKASMLAAAAAHAAGLASPAAAAAEDATAAPAAAAGTGVADTDAGAAGAAQAGAGVSERPVSPAVQAGLALSNLSLLQHLSSGHLQQALAHSPSPRSRARQEQQQQQYTQQDQQVLQAVSSAAVAAAGAGGAAPAAAAAAAAAAAPPGGLPIGGMLRHTGAVTGDPAVTDSLNASHAAAAAIQAAASSMQRVPVHPYMSQSLGVQRYACDVAVMHSSQGSPHAWGMLSPGSTPGTHGSRDAAAPPNMPPPLLQQQQQGVLPPPLQQQQHRQAPGVVPPAWSPQAVQAAAAAATPGGTLVSSGMAASPYWQQQQQLVSTVSGGGTSPGWVPDPVAQALQGEVDRLRQQLQQLQHQLRLAGMSLRGPELEPPAFTASPQQPLLASPPPGATPAHGTMVMAPVGSPGVAAMHIAHVSLQQQQQQVEQQLGGQYGGVGGQGAPTDWGAAAAAAAAAGSAAAMAFAQEQQQRVAQEATATHITAAPAPGPAAAVTAAAAGAAAPTEQARAPSQGEQQQQQKQGSGGVVAAPHPAGGSAVVQEPPVSDMAAAPKAAASQSNAAASEVPSGDAAGQKQQRKDKRAGAPRQRRRKLTFNAAAGAAGVQPGGGVAQEQTAAGDGSGSDSSNGGSSRSSSRSSGRDDGEGVPVEEPVACSSPAVVLKKASGGAAAAGRSATPRSAAAAAAAAGGGAESARGSTQGGLWRSSVARSSAARSSGGGLGPLRVSLEVPPLVEVVRARVVELSDDSDSEEWEDRLMAKYGLK